MFSIQKATYFVVDLTSGGDEPVCIEPSSHLKDSVDSDLSFVASDAWDAQTGAVHPAFVSPASFHHLTRFFN